jgi:Flp pilus assembly protein TadG
MMPREKQRADGTRDESGHAMLELAIVIPLLSMIAVCSLELSIQLGSYQIATQLSRELASLTYRRCVIDSSGSSSAKFNPDACIDGVLAEFATDVAGVAPGTQFVASLYNSSGVNVQQSSIRSFGTQASNYTLSDFSSKSSSDPLVNALSNSVSELGSVIVAEVYIPHSPLPGSIRFLNSGNSNWIYASIAI